MPNVTQRLSLKKRALFQKPARAGESNLPDGTRIFKGECGMSCGIDKGFHDSVTNDKKRSNFYLVPGTKKDPFLRV